MNNSAYRSDIGWQNCRASAIVSETEMTAGWRDGSAFHTSIPEPGLAVNILQTTEV